MKSTLNNSKHPPEFLSIFLQNCLSVIQLLDMKEVFNIHPFRGTSVNTGVSIDSFCWVKYKWFDVWRATCMFEYQVIVRLENEDDRICLLSSWNPPFVNICLEIKSKCFGVSLQPKLTGNWLMVLLTSELCFVRCSLPRTLYLLQV